MISLLGTILSADVLQSLLTILMQISYFFEMLMTCRSLNNEPYIFVYGRQEKSVGFPPKKCCNIEKKVYTST